jgi:hypothetical protein
MHRSRTRKDSPNRNDFSCKGRSPIRHSPSRRYCADPSPARGAPAPWAAAPAAATAGPWLPRPASAARGTPGFITKRNQHKRLKSQNRNGEKERSFQVMGRDGTGREIGIAAAGYLVRRRGAQARLLHASGGGKHGREESGELGGVPVLQKNTPNTLDERGVIPTESETRGRTPRSGGSSPAWGLRGPRRRRRG